MTEFTTEIFRIPASVYLKAEARDFAFKWSWLIALPLIILVSIGLTDYRYFLVALMYLFVVMPMIMVIVYFSRLLSPEVCGAMKPMSCHCVKGKHIDVSYFTEAEGGYALHHGKRIAWSDILHTTRTNSHFLIKHKGEKVYLIIPIPEKVPLDFFEESQ